MKPTVIWSNDDITVWNFPLAASQDELDFFASTLDPLEFAWAHSFGTPEARRATIVRRAQLRILLAQQLENEPNEIEFEKLRFGKPVVKGREVYFSASARLEFGSIALSKTKEIGVDLEKYIPFLLTDSREFFPDKKPLDPDKQDELCRGTMQTWTRREAIAKATGRGIRAMDEIPELGSGETIQIFDLTVTVQDIPAPDGYHQAIAWMVT